LVGLRAGFDGWMEGLLITVQKYSSTKVFSFYSFQDVLTSDDCDKSPIIFMRDVSFSELQSLISFIYSGQAVVPGNIWKRVKSLIDISVIDKLGLNLSTLARMTSF
jgi:hypothetical protein